MSLFGKWLDHIDPDYEAAKKRFNEAADRIVSQISILDIEFKGETIEMDLEKITNEWKIFSPEIPGMYTRLSSLPSTEGGTTIECMTIACRMKDAPHRHRNWEGLFMLEGSMRDLVTGKVYKSGDYASWEPMEWHWPEFLEDSFCLLMWKPALPVANKEQ